MIKVSKSAHKDEICSESTQEISTTTKLSKVEVSKKFTQEFDAGDYMKVEREKLVKKLEASNEEDVIFKKRVKKLRKNAKHDDESYRGSRYWGVSKNKSKWQVMITLNHYKEYNGGFSDELEAARVYDRKSICTFGLKAKTNNDYTKAEIVEILKYDCPIVL